MENYASDHLKGIREIACAFTVSPATVREWIEEGMPHMQIGSKYHARFSEIWDWLLKKNNQAAKPVK